MAKAAAGNGVTNIPWDCLKKIRVILQYCPCYSDDSLTVCRISGKSFITAIKILDDIKTACCRIKAITFNGSIIGVKKNRFYLNIIGCFIDAYRNCCRKRRSFSKNVRRSVTP